MNNFQTIFSLILDAIEYSGDKSKFISEFEENIKLESLMLLLKDKTQAEQQDIKTKLQENPKSFNSLFDGKDVSESLKEVTSNSIKNYLIAIQDSLTPGQKENLQKVLLSVKDDNNRTYAPK